MRNLLSIKELEARLEPILRSMETRGILLDTRYLDKLARSYAVELDVLRAKIYREAGHEFTLDSPRQLAGILYAELHLDSGDEIHIRKTKTGRSTAAAQLNKLFNLHPIVPLVLEYREKKKLLSTYIEPLPKLVDAEGRLHTHYSIDTAAGRLSSRNPNLQNIPVRSEDGRKIRAAFSAPRGKKLFSIDYSQIELRIAAHLSGDENLKQAFLKGEDIHTATAAKMSVDRRVAKAINFGVLFGQGAYGLSEALHISHEEAQAFIDQYFATYPKLGEWVEIAQAEARERGYAETLLGRRRYLAEINSSNSTLRSFAERVAINHPIQGAEAEIMALAMIEINQKIEEKDAALLLQVHDELVFEAPQSINVQSSVISRIQKIMEGVIDLAVPIVTEAKCGKNWAEMENIRGD
ncbi:hypothetical protein HYW32_02365 [Candidatus Berkelbacteria bacterium]|nr:hypothetical protein [Candidatus Berkelbacteria bacterium]